MKYAQERRTRVMGAVRRYRILLAALVGLSLPATRMAIDALALPVANSIEIPVRIIFYCFALATLCWPLTSYALAFRLSLVSSIALVCAGMVNMFVRKTDDVSLVPWFFPIVYLAVFVTIWGVGFAIISSLVFVRIRYWPVYPPGHCERCGYNLFGLQSGRCPECGTAFVLKKTVEDGMRQQELGQRQLSHQLSCGERPDSNPSDGRC